MNHGTNIYKMGRDGALKDVLKIVDMRIRHCRMEFLNASKEDMLALIALVGFADGICEDVRALLEDKKEGHSIDGGL